MKGFEVKLTIEAESEEQIEKWIDRMPHADRIYDCEIVDPDKPHYMERIRYDENWSGEGEHFVFEGRWSNEKEWGLDSAFPIVNKSDLKDDNEKEKYLIHYTALTKIRELKNLGIDFYFR